MKIIWIALLAIFLVACNSQSKTETSKAEETTSTAEARWVEVVLNVNGMTCEGCENAINVGVGSLEGVAEVESSHEASWTRVKFDENITSMEEISGKITQTGYEVKGEKAESAP